MAAVDIKPIPNPGNDPNWRTDWENWKKVRNHFPYYNVKDYGAKGDGVTDDILAIERAITAATGGAGTGGGRNVYFPPGDYCISRKIDLKSLMNISGSLVAQGYFTMCGDNPNTTRIIPSADMTGGMIECVNAGTGNAANARQLYFKGFSLYSDDTLNKSSRYGFYLKWCAEVYFENVRIINCVTQRGVYYDTTFVCSFKDCVGIGDEGSQGDPGTDEPDDVSYAFNNVSQAFAASNSGGSLLLTFPLGMPNLSVIRASNSGGGLPGNLSASTDYWLVRLTVTITETTCKVSTSEANALAGIYIAYSSAGTGTQTAAVPYNYRLTGYYFANTCTTTLINTCRTNTYRVNVNFNNGDMMDVLNSAIESAPDYGVYLSGSTANINIFGNYWEGNTGNIYVGARADSLNVQGNFLHGGDYGIKIVSATIRAGVIDGNYFFSSTDGIILDEPSLDNLSVRRNYFDVDGDELVYTADEFNTYGAQGHRLDWADNYTTNSTNARRFWRESKNINRIDFQDWTSSGGGLTLTSSTKKLRQTSTYTLTAPTQSDFIYYEIATIGGGQNADLAGSWITVLLPIIFTSIASYTDVGVTFSNSAGDLLCTHTSDFPDGSTVRYSGGTMPGSIVANTSYQVVRITATTCKLTAGAGNIPYSSAGSGTITMGYYQSGGKIRIDDGVTQHDYLLNMSEMGVEKSAHAYCKLSDSANTITIRLYPNGANFDVENMVVLKGLWGDSEIRADYNGKMYVHPPLQSGQRPIRLYQGPTSNIVIAEIDNPGSPSYGAMRVRDNGGDPVVEMNGGIGFQTLVNNIPFIFYEGPRIRAGSGTPEGNVTAAIGSVYLRSNGSAGTSAYVKESGSGNTGWVALGSDTTANLYRVLWTKTASTTVANTGTETTLLDTGVGSKTLTAAFFTIGKTAFFEVIGFYSNLLTPTLQLKMKLGSTVVLDTGAIVTPAGVTNQQFRFRGQMTCRTTGATGTIFAQGEIIVAGLSTPIVTVTNTAAMTIDTTGTLAVDVTATWGTANVANTITATNGQIEAEG